MQQMDFTVKIVEHRTSSIFDGRGNLQKYTRVSIYVGPFGPFTQDFLEGQDSPPQIQAWINNKKAEVTALNTGQ